MYLNNWWKRKKPWYCADIRTRSYWYLGLPSPFSPGEFCSLLHTARNVIWMMYSLYNFCDQIHLACTLWWKKKPYMLCQIPEFLCKDIIYCEFSGSLILISVIQRNNQTTVFALLTMEHGCLNFPWFLWVAH